MTSLAIMNVSIYYVREKKFFSPSTNANHYIVAQNNNSVETDAE